MAENGSSGRMMVIAIAALAAIWIAAVLIWL
jgi:hypothetical protein